MMQAMSEDGEAFRFATKKLKNDEEILQHVLEQSRNCRDLVGLKVGLMSGRCCSEVFTRRTVMWLVLLACAASLDLDRDYVMRNVLMRGPIEVKDLRELEPGKLHEITLVLS